MTRPLAATASLAMLASASPAAATEQDFNVWLGQFATIDASDDFYVRLEAQERFNDDASRLGQLLLRSLVAYRFSDKVSAGVGYAYV